MHNYDNKYPARPGFELGTSRLQAPVDKNKPSGEGGLYNIVFTEYPFKMVSSGGTAFHRIFMDETN